MTTIAPALKNSLFFDAHDDLLAGGIARLRHTIYVKLIKETHFRIDNISPQTEAQLMALIADAILLPDGTFNLATLDRFIKELSQSEEHVSDKNIAAVLAIFRDDQNLQKTLREINLHLPAQHFEIISQTVCKQIASPSAHDIRVAILATCLYPIQSATIGCNMAWINRLENLPQFMKDLHSLLQHGYIEREIAGDTVPFFGFSEDSSDESYMPPLVNLWRSSIQSMLYPPRAICCETNETNTMWYREITQALLTLAENYNHTEAALVFRSSLAILSKPSKLILGKESFVKIPQLQWMENIRLFGILPKIYFKSGERLISLEKETSLWIQSLKWLYIQQSKEIDLPSLSDFDKNFKKIMGEKLFPVYPVDMDLYQDSFFTQLTLGQIRTEKDQTIEVPFKLDAILTWFDAVRQNSSCKRLLTKEAIFLPNQGTDIPVEERHDLIYNLSNTLFASLDSREREEVLVAIKNCLLKDFARLIQTTSFEQSFERTFRFSIWHERNTENFLEKIPKIVTTFIQTFIAPNKQKGMLPEWSQRLLDLTILNLLHDDFPKEVCKSLVKVAILNEMGDSLYFWYAPCTGQLAVQYSTETKTFSFANYSTIKWICPQSVMKKIPPELQKIQTLYEEIFKKGLESTDELDIGTEGMLQHLSVREDFYDVIKTVSLKKLLPPILPEQIFAASILFLQDRGIKPVNIPSEVSTELKKMGTNLLAKWASLLKHDDISSLFQLNILPYLIADTLTCSDGRYNLDLSPIVIDTFMRDQEPNKEIFYELVSSLGKFIQNPSLRTAIEEIPIPTLEEIQKIVRHTLLIPSEDPITLKHVRVLLLGSFITCMRQFHDDCAIFAPLCSLKENHPERMILHWKQIFTTGGVQGTSVQNGNVFFCTASSYPFIRKKDLPCLFSFPCVQEKIKSFGEKSAEIQQSIINFFDTNDFLLVPCFFEKIGFTKTETEMILRARLQPFLQTWEFSVGSALFGPIDSKNSLQPLQKEWASKLLSECHEEAQRLGVEKLCLELEKTRVALESSVHIDSGILRSLSPIRHALVSYLGSLLWMPYTGEKGSPSPIFPNNTEIFSKIFLDMCSAIGMPGEELASIKPKILTKTYGECFSTSLEYCCDPFPSFTGCLKNTIDQLDFWGLAEASTLKLLPCDRITLSPSRLLQLPPIIQENFPLLCQADSISGEKLQGHVFRLLPDKATWTLSAFQTAEKLSSDLWTKSFCSYGKTLIDNLREKLTIILGLRKAKDSKLLQSVESQIGTVTTCLSKTPLMYSMRFLIDTIQSLAKIRFNRAEMGILDLVLFRSLITKNPELCNQTCIKIADTNWFHCDKERPGKINLGLYFSPFLGTWQQAYMVDNVILDKTSQFPRGFIQKC